MIAEWETSKAFILGSRKCAYRGKRAMHKHRRRTSTRAASVAWGPFQAAFPWCVLVVSLVLGRQKEGWEVGLAGGISLEAHEKRHHPRPPSQDSERET
jgi:hypothetical protein